ncbi:CpaE family protein [Notoacmeibacter sp. MSK16QG-6]|uniref:AAA family ATPase n=1 Tax=Notoacmeibacter sp. MSK16QG-6 TaxID=2957982 RepID=UPI0020A1CDA4|nr:CpaE family protein [Notoacmeibacter sp. MSK16QG-6]MCP1198765.1 CpaE family protein [Notoacmeibacter sp. MSK16QG-6]
MSVEPLHTEPGLEEGEVTLSSRDRDKLDSARPIPRITIHAWCDSAGVQQPIERAAQDRRMARAHVTVHTGGVRAAAEYYAQNTTPNLLLVETRVEPEYIMKQLANLAEVCDSSTRVVVIGHFNDVSLYREMMRSGISEYMVAPVSLADLIAAIETIYSTENEAPLGRSIAFVGAKGGVGASTIAHNVAWAVTNLFENDVVIADMDLAFGTANINFDQDPAQGIAEAVFSPERVDETYLDRLLSKCSDRLSLLAAPSTLERVYDFDEAAFASIVEVMQATTPIVILDVPHSWHAWTRRTLAEADEIVIVATPELTNLRNAKNIIDTMKRLRPNDPPPHLIINQAGMPKRPEIDPADFVDPLGIKPLAVIPFDPQLFGTAATNGQMLEEMTPDHAVVQKINEVARVLTGRRELKAGSTGMLHSILKKLKGQ